MESHRPKVANFVTIKIQSIPAKKDVNEDLEFRIRKEDFFSTKRRIRTSFFQFFQTIKLNIDFFATLYHAENS